MTGFIEKSYIAEMYAKNKYRNKRLDYWHEHLINNHASDDNFCFLDISLWDVFIGLLAVIDLFVDESHSSSIHIAQHSPMSIMKNILKRGKRVGKFFFPHNLNQQRAKVVFMAFERRQASCFVEALNILNKGRISHTILTTKIPSHAWPVEINSENQNIAYLEGGLTIIDYYEVFYHYKRIMKWLNKVKVEEFWEKNNSEIVIILNNIKTKLLYVLLLIKFSQKSIEKIKPDVIVGADISDLRSRAVFLMAKQYKIPTYHIPYGVFGAGSFEHRYLAADKKLVYSAKNRDLLVEQFDLQEESIKIIGCPRFDYLFKLKKRNKKKQQTGTINILIGSQPPGGGLPLSSERKLKLEIMGRFFGFIKGSKSKVILKPHPDEKKEEIKDIVNLARKLKIEIDVINALDINSLINDVDVFVTFFSMLSLEFMILGIPVCFLKGVQEIPIYNSACANGIAKEVFNKKDWEDFIAQYFAQRDDFNEKSMHFLKSEFTKTDGTSSSELVKVLLENIA